MFNVEKVTNDLIKWIQDWFEENGKGCNAIIGISGGKDSMVLAKLFQQLKKHSDFNFDVEYIVMDPGYNPKNLELIKFM